MKKYNIIFIINMFLLLILILLSCAKTTFFYQPNPKIKSSNIDFEKCEIEIVDFSIQTAAVQYLPFSLKLKINNNNNRIYFYNDVFVSGLYFVSTKSHPIVKNSVRYNPNRIINVENGEKIYKISGILVKKEDKDINFEYFFDCFKYEKFSVQFPTFVINDKEYKPDKIEFIYKN